ncbi:hypothetical protein PG993_008302 [Apiospora rasikravindrae]|uniref:Uncharacterized protein n=1 Tax=Apiospora rasikravindrae TaxID=990691 RepID=A0ABR1T1E0_9PEZI
MAPGAGKPCSWSTTPASKEAEKGPEMSCAIEEGHSTPPMIREMTKYHQQLKAERYENRNCHPDPARQTVCGFAVDHKKLADAGVAGANNPHEAATASAASGTDDPSELTMTYISACARVNQAAMRQNGAINTAPTNQTEPPHVTFAGVAAPPQPHPQPQPKKVGKKGKKKVRSPPQAPPQPPLQKPTTKTPPPPPPAGIDIYSTTPERPWTKSYRCVRNPTYGDEGDSCESTCTGVTVWCQSDKRFLPCMHGPNRRPGSSEGEPLSDFDLEAIRKGSSTF